MDLKKVQALRRGQVPIYEPGLQERVHRNIAARRVHCTEDVKALMATARDVGLEFDLLRAVESTNARQKRCLLSKALRHYGDVSHRTFAVWGLAFKPKTDDMREAPSVALIEGLLGKGARVQCHDPVATEVAQRLFGDRVLYAPPATPRPRAPKGSSW